MTYDIQKAAVIGSGTMGGGIATLLAGVGVETILLDIPAKDTHPGDPANKRNSIVLNNIKALKKARPPQLYNDAVMDDLSVGNIEDDLDNLGDVDWIIEVVIEKLDIKQNLMAKLAEVAKPEAIITSNTSGLPIQAIAENLGNTFTRRFMGTHFFNPPRYLRLLEVIPHSNTDPDVVDFIVDFATNRLGKGVVVCKDTPNFIGNRFMSMIGMQAMNYALDHSYTIEEVDALTGPLIGRPKTATFNLNDLVGFDVAVHVAHNLYENIPDDPSREVLNHPKSTAISEKMLENNWLGRKSGQGFYHMKRDGDKRELWALNLETMEYEPPTRPRFDSASEHRRVKPLGKRLKLLLNADDRAGQYLWHHHAFYLAYASQRIPEITGSIANIDNAQRWGFNHELGPFEIWDALGVEETIPQFERAGYLIADWVKQMVVDGKTTFYQYDGKGIAIGYYNPQDKSYHPLEKDPRCIVIADLHTAGKEVVGNNDASILDMGDGVLLFEFHSKQNTLTGSLLEVGYEGLELLKDPKWKAMVVGNDFDRFSIGAGLDTSAFAAGPQGIENMVKTLQDLTQAMRYAPKPVVTAVHNMTLGGGCEVMMGGVKTVAHIELYAGQVEIGVGLVPAGGGCKELLRRVISPIKRANINNDVLPKLQDVFQNIALGTVSVSARDAVELGYLDDDDMVVMNRSHLLGEAKQAALQLAQNYVPRKPEPIWAAGRDAYAALLIGIEGFREGGYATDYDAVIAEKIAYILTGGALSQPQWVDQQVILDLEREAFIALLQETKTIERIMYMLENNKPLRN